MLSQKLLLDVGVDTFAGENRYIGGVNLLLIPLALLLSAPWTSSQVLDVV
jgi:hypothetical protein